MAPARLIVAFSPGERLSFIVAIQNLAKDDSGLLVPRTLQPPDLFFTATIRDADGEELYTSPRAKAGLKLHPGRPESYLSVASGDAIATVLTIPRGEIKLATGGYRAEIRYDAGSFTGPGGSGAPSNLEAEIDFSIN